MHPQITHNLLDPVICQIAISPMNLQRLIGDPKADIGHEPLGHCAVTGGIRGRMVQLPRSLTQEQPRRLQFSFHIRQLELKRLKVSQRATNQDPSWRI